MFPLIPLEKWAQEEGIVVMGVALGPQPSLASAGDALLVYSELPGLPPYPVLFVKGL